MLSRKTLGWEKQTALKKVHALTISQLYSETNT
jgi:hypothetical protein